MKGGPLIKTPSRSKPIFVIFSFYLFSYNTSNETKKIINFYKITVLTVRFDKSLKKKENLGRVRVLREDFAFALSRSKYSVRIIFRFLGIVKNFDVVVINSPSSNILPIAIITKIFGKKLIIFHQGDLILPKGFINRIIEKIFDISCYFSFL